MEIDILSREVRTGESVIHLSGIEQSLLYLLASRSGRVVSRDEILDAVWGTDFVAESNIVDRHIRTLRIKLQNDYRHPRFIATVPGQGYRFIPTFSNRAGPARATRATGRSPCRPHVSCEERTPVATCASHMTDGHDAAAPSRPHLVSRPEPLASESQRWVAALACGGIRRASKAGSGRKRSDMKRIGTIGLAACLAVTLAGTVLAAASVNLGAAKSFAVLAGETITNTGATTITGDIGLAPGTAVTGFTDVTLDGAQHLGDAVALDAKNALVTAYNDAAGATPVTKVATELGGTTLKPGVYGSATLGLTGTLTLDGEGLYIFQAGSTLITAPDSKVELIGGASACDVYWQVGSSATLDTNTKFKGTIMALTSIALNKGVTIQGRALARNGAVTMINDTIDSSSCAAPSPTPTPKATPKRPPRLPRARL